MFPANQRVRIYRLRVALLRTCPHVWRHMLVRSSCRFTELHHTIRCSFDWNADHPYRFLIRSGTSSDNNATTSLSWSECAWGEGKRVL